MRKSLIVFSLLFILSVLSGCNTQIKQTATPEKTPAPVTALVSPTAMQTATETAIAPFFSQISVLKDRGQLGTKKFPIDNLPQLWNRIDKEKITIYSQNWLSDYAYEKDGGVWAVGGFGVIHQDASGKQTWYSMKNGLPVNFFTRVAISPKGEVWIGGVDNALFRFDGVNWIDEGSKLPPPLESAYNWLCYSQDISGIDFDDKGSVWVMNNGINLYTQGYGQWLSFPFPEKILPLAGGGACPLGIRVKSENDITIERSGCCGSSPVGYHYDGKTWNQKSDYSVVDELLKSRHTTDIKNSENSVIKLPDNSQTNLSDESGDFTGSKSVFLPDDLLLYSSNGVVSIHIGQDGAIWLLNGSNLYRNTNGLFQPYTLQDYTQLFDPSKNVALLQSGDYFYYFENGKAPIFTDSVNASLDDQNRIWFYDSKKGLTVINNGTTKILSENPVLHFAAIGATLHLKNGLTLVGGSGLLWIFDGKSWQQLVLPGVHELFSSLLEDKQGIVYAATSEGVYKIDMLNRSFTSTTFVRQDTKPFINDFDDICEFHAQYKSTKNCWVMWGEEASLKFHFTARLLAVQADGTIYYVNNKIVARFKNGLWTSFLFDTVDIGSAAVGKDGSVWIYTDKNGLIGLASDIFDANEKLKILPSPQSMVKPTITSAP